MTDKRRAELIQQLGELMSDLSEVCYCAGWLGGTEYFVPELCRRAIATQQTLCWGHGEVTPEFAAALTGIASELGHWVDSDLMSVGYEPFNPFPIPPEYVEAIDREQSYPPSARLQESMGKDEGHE